MEGTAQDRTLFLEQLRAAHEFPGPYIFKLIGDNSPVLLDSALEVLRSMIPSAEPSVSRRESSKGRHQSITLELRVEDAETVLLVYEQFRKLQGVRVML
jgi:putative lipoic acid-binding regulatory protein